MEIISVLAILFSPLIAIWVTQFIRDGKEVKDRQYQIFLTLISTRHAVITEDQVKALNSIDVVFSKCLKVRQKWKEYFDILLQKDRQTDWNKKKLELLKEMSDVVGYKNSIDHLDLDRIYCPTGMIDKEATEARISKKWEQFLDSAKVITVEKTPQSNDSNTDSASV